MKHAFFRPMIAVLQGMAIGIANVIPGVSGGTIAVLVGVYDQLIEALADFFSRSPRWLGSFVFLTKLSLGAVIGILLFARVIDYAFTNHEVPTLLFFVGLVLGSGPVLYSLSGSRRPRPAAIAAFVVAAAVLSMMGVMQPEETSQVITQLTPQNALLLFSTGLMSLATMIIPGLSASFVLLLMGVYPTLLRAVNELNFAVLGIFFIGGVIGLLAVSKVIRFLLHRYHHVTYFAILGLVFGSAVTIWPAEGVSFDAAGMIGVISLLSGGGLAGVLGKRPGGPKDGLAADRTTESYD